MVLEIDRSKLEEELEEELKRSTLANVAREVSLLKGLQTPLGYQDTPDGKHESRRLGEEQPLTALLTPEVMEEVDALSWMSFLDPLNLGKAIPSIYGHDVVLFEKGHLRPKWAEALAANLQLAVSSTKDLEGILDTASQRIREILFREITGVASEFDKNVSVSFLEAIGEDTFGKEELANLLRTIEDKKQTLTQQLGPRINRGRDRASFMAKELSVYKDIPHEEAIRIVLELFRTSGQYNPQTLQEAGAEDHILECGDHPLCRRLGELYGHQGDFLSDPQKQLILAEIQQSFPVSAPSER